MRSNPFHRLEQWLRRATFRWSLRTRLLAVLLLAELAILAVVSAIAVAGYQWVAAQMPGAPQVVSHLLAYQAISAALAFSATAGVVIVLVGSLARNLTDIAAAVEQQTASGSLDIAVTPGREDEIGRLVAALNNLGQAYRTSLQNLARQADERAVLDLLAATINRTLDLQQVLDTSLRETLVVVKWDMGAVYMWDDRDDSLNMVSYIGLSEDVVRRNIVYKLGEGLIGRAAQAREILVADSERRADDTTSGLPGAPVAHVIIPLVTVPGQLLGVLDVGSSQHRALSHNELGLLKTVASQVAIAIDKAQLYTKVSQHAAELEKLVAARTVQLSRAIEELGIALEQAQEADRVKSLLLSTVSHELRTPLATIKGNTSLLIQHHDRISPEQFIEHLSDIEEETDKLTELISNLLEMSRIEAGMLHIQAQPLNIVDMLQGTVDAAQVRLPHHPLHLSWAEPTITVMGDARRIEQIVANLLDNAAKYSPQGTPVEIRAKKSGAEAIVSVRDYGKGIAPEHLGRLFDRFYQINQNRDSGRHGIGLGLAICRGLVEAQRGRIWVESQVGQGSTFCFSLPAISVNDLQEER